MCNDEYIPQMHDGVHRTHCCVLHGCKYGDDNCPVCLGHIEQKYLCEDCSPIHSNRLPNDYEDKQRDKFKAKIRELKINRIVK